MLRVEDVRRAALEGRVGPAEVYHAFVHHVRWDDLVLALRACTRLAADRRRNSDGTLRHPAGFVAWGPGPGGRAYRVDFNVEHTPEEEPMLLIVTGFEVFP